MGRGHEEMHHGQVDFGVNAGRCAVSPGFSLSGDGDGRRDDSRPLRRHGSRGRPPAWLRRHGRHVGAGRGGARQRPCGNRSRSPRHGALVLVAGRERIYLDRFWNELSANPKAIGEATRQHYAELYARPGAMHSAFNQFAAFAQDLLDNKAFAAKGKLTMPVLAIGAEKSFGTAMADDLGYVATNVTSVVIANSGHWLMEEQPAATIAAIRAFLDKK